MRIISAIIWISLCSCIIAREYSFEAITSGDGLSQNSVLSVYQDSEGFMWFGTVDGLNRYDGKEFKIYRKSTVNNNSIGNNIISCITGDDNKNIWAGTLYNGVSIFNLITEKFTHISNSDEHPNTLTDNLIQSIFFDSRKNIWLSTPKGINVISNNAAGGYEIIKIEKRDDDPKGLSASHVNRVFEDSFGRIWISTLTSLELMNMGNEKIIRNNFYKIISDGFHADFDDIFEIPNHINEYLITCNLGIIHLKLNAANPGKSTFKMVDRNPARRIECDKDGILWTSGHNGLHLYKYQDNIDVHYVLTDHYGAGKDDRSLNNKNIRDLFIDKYENIWMGTNGGGVIKCNPGRSNFRHYKNTEVEGSLSYDKVSCFKEDKHNNLWIGTEGGGLNFLPATNSKNYRNGFQYYDVNPPIGQNFVFDIIDISTNHIPTLLAGVGYPHKLVKIEWRGNHWQINEHVPNVSHHVTCLLQDEFGAIWTGTYLGALNRYIPSQGGKIQNFNQQNSLIPTHTLRKLFEDSKGRLWIGTTNGLAVLSREQKRSDLPEFTIFKNDINNPSSISNNDIIPITETSQGDIWIGTFGGGLNKYIEGTNPTNGHFEHLTEENGLLSNNIKAIVEDDRHNLWISTNRGITQVNIQNHSVRNFDTSDGLQGLEFVEESGYKRHDGEMLFGGMNGFNAFYPDEISQNIIPPDLVFTKFEIFNTPIDVGEEINGRIMLEKSLNELDGITIKHTENNFTIHFAALHHSAPYKNQYKYKLEGYDKDWYKVKSNRSFSKYTNLKAGEYTFMFIGSNCDGVWNNTPKTLKIRIKPPFWQTAAFQITLVVLILVAFIVIYKFRVQKLNQELKRRKEQEKILMLSNKKAEESDRLKTAILNNLSHELRTPVNGILGFTEILSGKKVSEEKSKKFFNIIRQNCHNLIGLLDTLLEISTVKSGDVKVFSEVKMIGSTLEESKARALTKIRLKHKDIDLVLKGSETDLEQVIKTDHYKISTVLDHLLDNAIKFTESGIIEIAFAKNNNALSFTITDTGIGIAEENKEVIFEEFRQTEIGLTREYAGIGLGLAICKSYVHLLGGEIGVHSEQNKGATFFFSIPFQPVI